MTSSTRKVFKKPPAPHTKFSKMTISTQGFQKSPAPHTFFSKMTSFTQSYQNQQHHTKSFQKSQFTQGMITESISVSF